MKALYRSFILLISIMPLTGCSSSEWEDLPDPIAHFVAQYFPEEGVADYGETGNVYYVKLRGSAALSFDSNFAWISVDGEGSTLPQVLLFDQLPPALYEYIQENSSLTSVYKISRNTRDYHVTLSDTYLTYNISNKTVSEEYPSKAESD